MLHRGRLVPLIMHSAEASPLVLYWQYPAHAPDHINQRFSIAPRTTAPRDGGQGLPERPVCMTQAGSGKSVDYTYTARKHQVRRY